jgi:hypothetical protein
MNAQARFTTWTVSSGSSDVRILLSNPAGSGKDLTLFFIDQIVSGTGLTLPNPARAQLFANPTTNLPTTVKTY